MRARQASAGKRRTFRQQRLFYAAGVRLSELAGLFPGDLMARDHGDGQVTVFGKGGKTRAVLLNPATFAELVAIGAEEPLFKARTSGRLTTRQIERIVKTAALQAGLSPRVSPHWLRHWRLNPQPSLCRWQSQAPAD